MRGVLRTHELRSVRTGSAKPVSRLDPEATTFTAHRLFKRESSCIAKRSWQEHPPHTSEDVVATITCGAKHLRDVTEATESDPADVLTKAPGRSKLVEFCAEIGQTEPQAKTVDKKAVTFAVGTNDEMI